MELRLVSLKACPYVQRSVITLKHKGVDFDVTYIDLEDPPQWFLEASPLGKVPILFVRPDGADGGAGAGAGAGVDDEPVVLFESAVINEFVDEVTPGSLLPENPVERARARGWIEFGSECLVDWYQAATAADQATYAQHRDALASRLRRLETEVEQPFFLGEAFSLVDAAIAPLLMRLEATADVAPELGLDSHPRLRAWSDRLVSLPEVRDSMVPEWRELTLDMIGRSGGYLGQRLAPAA